MPIIIIRDLPKKTIFRLICIFFQKKLIQVLYTLYLMPL